MRSLKARLMTVYAGSLWAMMPEALAELEAAVMAMPDGADADLSPRVLADLERLLGAEGAAEHLNARSIHPSTERATAAKAGGVAIIPIKGLITRHLSFADACAGVVATDPIKVAEAVERAASDENIKAIVADVNSPGGVTTGVPEAFTRILAVAKSTKKPMVAQVNGLCASAGYWLASAFPEISITPSGMIGSIGVYTHHDNVAEKMAKEGVERTYISAGKHKLAGAPNGPLSEEAKALVQDRVDYTYAQFIDAVAEGRGDTAQAVRNGYGEGGVLMAKTGITAKLADRERTMEETMAAYGVTIATAGSGSANAARALQVRSFELDALSDH